MLIYCGVRVTNPNAINFTSSNWYGPLRFMNNSPDLGNDIDNSEETDLHVDFKNQSTFLNGDLWS